MKPERSAVRRNSGEATRRQRIEELLKQASWEEAERELTEIIVGGTREGDWFYARALARHNLGDYTDLESDLQRAAALKPELKDVPFLRDILLLSSSGQEDAFQPGRNTPHESTFLPVAQAREDLRRLLATPRERCPLLPQEEPHSVRENVSVFQVVYQTEPGVRVSAYYLEPAGEGPHPGIVYLHGHGTSKEDSVWKAESYMHAGAMELARAGFAVVAPDLRMFGELPPHENPNHYAATMHHLFQGAPLMGAFVWDGLRAVEFMRTRPRVDPDRLGIAGVSLGGEVTMFVAALSDSVRSVWIGNFFGDYQRILREKHCPCFVVPGMLPAWTMVNIAALIAPRPLMLHYGDRDTLLLYGSWDAYQELRGRYRSAVAESSLRRVVSYDLGHEYEPKLSVAWFRETLGAEK